MRRKERKVVQSKKSWRKRSHVINWQDWMLQFFMMVCLTFHTAIIINRKNWRINIKLHFENLSIFFFKKRTYTHDRTFPPHVSFCSLLNDPPPRSPPLRTYFLNDPKRLLIIKIPLVHLLLVCPKLLTAFPNTFY